MPKRQLFLSEVSQAPGTTAGDTYTSEPTVATVFDVTSQTPAIVGKLIMIFTTGTTNTGGVNYSQNATISTVGVDGSYGIVLVPASVQGGQAEVVQVGPVLALVTTQTSQIVPGNLLQADAVGNLVSVGGTLVVGQVLAMALSTVLTATNGAGLLTSPVKIPVLVGVA